MVIDKLKMVAISLALLGTPLFLHDIYMLDAIKPLRFSPRVIFFSDSCLYKDFASSIMLGDIPPPEALQLSLLITLYKLRSLYGIEFHI